MRLSLFDYPTSWYNIFRNAKGEHNNMDTSFRRGSLSSVGKLRQGMGMTKFFDDTCSIDKAAVERFCYSDLSLPESRRVSSFGMYAPSYCQWEHYLLADSQRGYTPDALMRPVSQYGHGASELREFGQTFCGMMNSSFQVKLLSIKHDPNEQAVCFIFSWSEERRGSSNPKAALAAFGMDNSQQTRFFDEDYLFVVAGSAVTYSHHLRFAKRWGLLARYNQCCKHKRAIPVYPTVG